MRHQKKTIKLGRTASHRKALLANQVCSLIEHQRIRTTFAVLRQKNAVKKLFDEIAPRTADRNGGYTRIVKLGQRKSDSAPIAYLEWVDAAFAVDEEPESKARKSKKEREQASSSERKSKKANAPSAK